MTCYISISLIVACIPRDDLNATALLACCTPEDLRPRYVQFSLGISHFVRPWVIDQRLAFDIENFLLSYSSLRLAFVLSI